MKPETLESLFTKFKMRADQYYEIEQMEGYIRNLEYDFVTATKYSDKKEIVLDYREAVKKLNWLNLGVFN